MSHPPGPITCSLALEETASQAHEWRDLQAHVLAAERIEYGMAITYPLAMAKLLADLVAREAACCSWLQLSTTSGEATVRLELTSEHPDAAPVIALLAGVGG